MQFLHVHHEPIKKRKEKKSKYHIIIYLGMQKMKMGTLFCYFEIQITSHYY